MVKRLLLRHLLGLACLAAAGLVASAAVADHHSSKSEAIAPKGGVVLQHQGTRCGGVSSAGIEARWNQREVAYAARSRSRFSAQPAPVSSLLVR